MEKHLHKEIEKLKEKILDLGSMVEQNLIKAVEAVNKNDLKLANEVMELDNEIDLTELEVEEDCLKILALHQPVAIDLRYIVAILKINSDLERIGDLAGNIAEVVTMRMLGDTTDKDLIFSEMAEISQGMVNKSLDSLVNTNTELAFQVCKEDDTIDEMYYKFRELINKKIEKRPENAKNLTAHLIVYRMLERVGDHATNIAEDVIYMIDGDIVRHRMKDFNKE